MMDVDSDPGPRPDPEAEALGEEDTIKGLLRDYEATTRTVQQSAEENASGTEVCVCVLVLSRLMGGLPSPLQPARPTAAS